MPKKLKLTRETIQTLNSQAADQANAGLASLTFGPMCPSANCMTLGPLCYTHDCTLTFGMGCQTSNCMTLGQFCPSHDCGMK